MSVHLLGVRHHGPGSARSVVAALDSIRPDAVLVEAPADVESSLAWVGRDGLVPPVALLGYVVADPSHAVFAPFASFSPEWQACAWANEHDVVLRAIDLPLATTLVDDPTAGAGELVAAGPPPDPLRQLAAAAGDPDPERWWEDVIEHRGDGEPAFDAVAEAMAAARAGTLPSRREERREAHMRRAIRAALRDGCETVAVVCGAWHVPALDVDTHTVKADTATLRGMAKVKVGSAWVPWSHRRLTSGSGYGAGVDSPGWYRHVHDHPGRDGVARFFVDAARCLRERGLGASPDHLIAGARLADGLAAMRGRPRPGLTEVLDAADAVMGGLDVIRDRLVVGDALGSVPDDAPQVPLARDLANAQRSARLRPDATPRTLEVDLRTPSGLRKSHLLHRLLALGVPWGVPEEGRGTSGTFRETWRLAWEPELSVRLVERSGYGSTVVSAATSRLIERAAAATSLPELVGVLELALFADLPDAVEPSVERLAERAATDPDVAHLMDVLAPLASALRYGDVRATDASSLRRVFDGLVVRVLAALAPACAALDDDAAAMMVERLTSVQTALAMLDHRARYGAFPAVLERLAERGGEYPASSGSGLIAGRATRLLHDGDVWDAGAVERRLGRALSGGTAPAVGAAFVEGFVAGSGTVLVHDTELLGVVDRWLSSLRPDAFDAVLALLRRTFGGFDPAERRQLMALLAGRAIERTTGFGDQVDAARAAAALVTVRHLFGLPLPDAPGGESIAVRRSPPSAEPAPTGAGESPQSSVAAPGGGWSGRELPQVSAAERRRRWRLVLGAAGDDSERDEPADRQTDRTIGDADPGDPADGVDTATPGSRPRRGGDGTSGLSDDDRRIDAALGALYDRDEPGGRPRSAGQRRGGLGRSKPGVVRWLGDIRTYFPTEVVKILQRDAVERLDLKRLLLEPELLDAVEPDIGLVTLLVELNQALPDETRDTARRVIAQVLAEVEARLADRTRRAVRGALARSARTRRPRPGDIDWSHTIAANLRHWLPEQRTIVPEQLIGHGRRQKSLARDVVIAVDQSGSMADSVVYASLFAAVLAQLPTLRTQFIAFDTAVTDLTAYLHDPVEVLFGVQLGGGTDIASALAYCERQIERPRSTVLVLISDLFEGGNGDLMRRRVASIVAAGAEVIVLLALSDEGAPVHDHDHAAALTALGATVMATTPDAFPDVLAGALV